MTTQMLELVIDRMNRVPHANGMSDVLSPATIVLGKGPIDFQCKTVRFGTCMLLCIETINTIKRRSTPCIALNPRNGHGGRNFMTLHAGAKPHRYY